MGDIEGGEGRSGESGGREGVLKYPQKVVERGGRGFRISPESGREGGGVRISPDNG